MINTLKRLLAITLSLYVIATLTSMAGMEIFSWLSVVLGLALFALRPDGSHASFWARLKRLFLRTDLVLLVFFVVVLAGVALTTPAHVSKVDVIGSARWVFMFLLLRIALVQVWQESYARHLVFGASVLLALISGYAIWQYFNGIDLIRGAKHVIGQMGEMNGRPYYRSEGLFGTPMTFANSLVLSLCFPIALFLFRAEKSRRHWIYSLVSLIALVALASTMTRGAWLAAVAACFAMVLFCRWRTVVIFFASVVLMVIVANIAAPELRGRFASITNLRDKSNYQRLDIWRANMEIVKDHPVIGIGYGVNEEVIGDYYPRIGMKKGFHGHAHNNLIQFLAGTGVLGTLCFLIFCGSYLLLTFKLARRSGDVWLKAFLVGAFGAQVALQIAGLTECNFKDAEINHQFLLILNVVGTVLRNGSGKPAQAQGALIKSRSATRMTARPRPIKIQSGG